MRKPQTYGGSTGQTPRTTRKIAGAGAFTILSIFNGNPTHRGDHTTVTTHGVTVGWSTTENSHTALPTVWISWDTESHRGSWGENISRLFERNI